MKIPRALPWFLASGFLLIAAICACYGMHLDRDRESAALVETMRAELAAIERLAADVNALRTAAQRDQTRIGDLESFKDDALTTSIKLSLRLNQTRRDVNDLWVSLFGVADANRVSTTFTRMNARLHDLAQATARDVADLHTRIDATQKTSRPSAKCEPSVNSFLAEMGRDSPTP